jgi:hypothetical protein
MMNSFDFNQTPQSVLIEPANFIAGSVSPAQGTTTFFGTQTTTEPSTYGAPQMDPVEVYLLLALLVAVAAIIPAYIIGRRGAKR